MSMVSGTVIKGGISAVKVVVLRGMRMQTSYVVCHCSRCFALLCQLKLFAFFAVLSLQIFRLVIVTLGTTSLEVN